MRVVSDQCDTILSVVLVLENDVSIHFFLIVRFMRTIDFAKHVVHPLDIIVIQEPRFSILLLVVFLKRYAE